MGPTAVDLFCGVGGLTHGFEAAGIDVSTGIDLDPDCRYPYEENNDATFIEADILELDGESVEEMFPEDSCKILAGCAPCQPFSNFNNAKVSNEMDDWGLLQEFGRLVREVRPTIVVMENVLEIRNHDVYSRFMDTLFKQRYHISYKKVDCTDYGVPQERKRLVVLASSLGNIELISPTHTTYEDRPTVRKTIGGDTTNTISAGEVAEGDILHRSQSLSDTNLKRIRQSEPGGTWRNWDEELRLECHQKDSGSSYESVYGRMEWGEPAPTITTQFFNYGSGRFGHPEENRAISLREGALLQTFPTDYEFVEGNPDEVHYKKVGRFIGNAVPVRLAAAIGESITDHLNYHDVTNRHKNPDRRGNAVRNVAQSQRAESPGTESVQ